MATRAADKVGEFLGLVGTLVGLPLGLGVGYGQNKKRGGALVNDVKDKWMAVASYDFGAIRDMVQNHIMQALCLTTMEAPVAFDAYAIRDEKVKVLRAVPLLTPEDVAKRTVRGQYTAGVINGQPQVSYKEEKGVSPASQTETYVALKLFIENWRWAEVPFYIRTGKALPKRSTEVTIQFKRVPHMLYKPAETKGLVPNRLTIRIQPDEGVSLTFEVKPPGHDMIIRPLSLDFNYEEAFGNSPPEAYEALLEDCIEGDSTLFTRSDEVEASWSLITPIHQGWEAAPIPEFPNYEAPLSSWNLGTT